MSAAAVFVELAWLHDDKKATDTMLNIRLVYKIRCFIGLIIETTKIHNLFYVGRKVETMVLDVWVDGLVRCFEKFSIRE